MSQPSTPPDGTPPGPQYAGEQPYGAQGYPGGYQPYTPARPTNTMAIVAVVSGVLGVTFLPVVGSIAAIITGHMARREIAQTGEEGSALALIGLILGYGILALMLLGVIAFFVFVAGMGVIGTTMGAMGTTMG